MLLHNSACVAGFKVSQCFIQILAACVYFLLRHYLFASRMFQPRLVSIARPDVPCLPCSDHTSLMPSSCVRVSFSLSALICRALQSRQVGVEIPIDSDEADDENKTAAGRTLLNILSRGYAIMMSAFTFSPGR